MPPCRTGSLGAQRNLRCGFSERCAIGKHMFGVRPYQAPWVVVSEQGFALGHSGCFRPIWATMILSGLPQALAGSALPSCEQGPPLHACNLASTASTFCRRSGAHVAESPGSLVQIKPCYTSRVAITLRGLLRFQCFFFCFAQLAV